MPNRCGHTWLENNLGAHVRWAKTHDSLFVLTSDEDCFKSLSLIATIFAGPTVKPGR